MLYEVVAFRKYVGFDKVWLKVEANSPKEAVDLVLGDSVGIYELDYDCLGMEGHEWLSPSEWSCYEIPGGKETNES
jgi:hypothetical protein